MLNNRDQALDLMNLINEKGVMLHKEIKDNVYGYIERFYLYKDYECRCKHIEYMISKGWVYNDERERQLIYGNFHEKRDEWVSCFCGHFVKYKEV